jgi:DNA-binding LacI/PurR family transcriptional regulator
MLGWLGALEAAGIIPVVVRASANEDDAAEDAARLLLDRPDPPTGVLCFSDVLALGAIRASAQLGLEVPGDVSVVGFDDNPLARRSRPTITTVRQDIAGKGRTAAAELLAAIEDARAGTRTTPRHAVLPTELVVRQSTGPAADQR